MLPAPNRKKGQAIVELAITLPILILIICGIVDFGFIFNSFHIINNASREGARMAALGKPDADIIFTVNNLTSTLNDQRLNTIVTPDEYVRQKGDEIEVRVEYRYQVLTPLISALLPNPVILRAKTAMRIE